jgi:tetratricopeptide (TPR) repeat protein
MWMTLLALAWASPTDLARSERAMGHGRPDVALAHARRALDDTPDDLEAWLAWLTACDAAGLGAACRAEAQVRGDDVRAAAVAGLWHDLRLERVEEKAIAAALPELPDLRAGRFDGNDVSALHRDRLEDLVESNPDDAASAGAEWLSRNPARPDVLIPLFADGLPARSSLGKMRKKLVGSGKKAIRKTEDVAVLYRWHDVFVATGSTDLAEQSADALAERGEPRPLTRVPWTRAETQQRARELMRTEGEVTFPDVVPNEREAIALRLADMLENGGRHAEAAERLATARTQLDSASMAIAHARALLEAGELQQAERVAGEAMQLSITPWPTDVAVAERLARRAGVAHSLALRGRVALANGRHADAVVDLMVANQLAFQPMETAALEDAMEKGRYELEQIKAARETRAKSAADIALEEARAALEQDDFDTVLTATEDAVAVLCLPAHRNARLTARLAGLPELASALALRGLAQKEAGNFETALTDVSVALLLAPFAAPSDWWLLKADLHDRLEQGEAAFFARSMASALGATGPDGETPLEPPDWQGSPEAGVAAAAALVSGWMVGNTELDASASSVQRGRVIAFRAPSSGGRARTTPQLMQPFPDWSITDDDGTIRHQQGRIEIMAFFRTDSPSSIRLLDELTQMARTLRSRENVNVVLFGICMDPGPDALADMRARREQWGTTKWDPRLGERLGVSAFPTTWIVDASGIARYKHVGYLGRSEYETEVRFLAGQ